MQPVRLMFLLGLSFISRGLAWSVAEKIGHGVQGLDALPRGVPADSLKSALADHLAPKYRDGVFENGNEAINAIHRDDPELAARLVDLAERDAAVRDSLQRRQNGNSTSQSASSPPGTTPITSDTSSLPSSLPSSPTTPTSIITSTSSPGQSSPSLSQTSTIVVSPASPTSLSSPSLLPASSTAAVPSSTTVIERSSTIVTITSTSEPVSTPSVPPVTSSTSSFEGQPPASTTVVTGIGSDKPTESSTTGVSITSSSTASSVDHGVSSAPTTPATSQPVVSPTPSSDPSTASGTQTGVLVPVTVSQTLPGGSVVGQSTDAFVSSAPTSLVIPITTSDGQGNPLVTSTTAPAIVLTGTDSNGSPFTTTSPLASVQVANGGSIVTSAPAFGASAGNQVTTEESQGVIVTRTIIPNGGTVSELHIRTETLSNGVVQTITSFDIVGPTPAGVDAAGASSPSSSKKPGLASAAVAPSSFYAAVKAVLLSGVLGVMVLL